MSVERVQWWQEEEAGTVEVKLLLSDSGLPVAYPGDRCFHIAANSHNAPGYDLHLHLAVTLIQSDLQ